MEEKIYKYPFSSNYIKYKLYPDTKEIHMEETYLDTNYFKIYLILLTTSISEFIESGYLTFHQIIPKEEYEMIKSGSWRFEEVQSDYFLYISCDIKDTIENILKGLGIENI